MPPPSRPGPRGGGVAFLLSQLGARSSEQFARALAEHDLTPALVGIMRQLLTGPDAGTGPSQQQLAEQMGLVPSRIVSYVDELESRGWIARTRGTIDRRVNVLAVTDAGREAFASIASLAREHEQRTTAGLDDADRATLFELLTKLAAAQELTPGVHPGYRQL
jgi:DNA-binding MarR family transcriptional regulator